MIELEGQTQRERKGKEEGGLFVFLLPASVSCTYKSSVNLSSELEYLLVCLYHSISVYSCTIKYNLIMTLLIFCMHNICRLADKNLSAKLFRYLAPLHLFITDNT